MSKTDADELLKHLRSIYPRLDQEIKRFNPEHDRRDLEDKIYYFAIEGGPGMFHNTQFILNVVWFFIHSCDLPGKVSDDSDTET